jgi:predicted membrane-bound mannosyltransferase
MHTDESVNAWILGEILGGESFHYDPQDRHGPALAAETLPIVRLSSAKKFSDLTESQLRLAPVLAGTVTVLLFGAAVEMFGFIACLVAALLFAFAPLPIYYSRDFIHETLFVAATFGLILAGWRALQKKSLSSVAIAGFCAALMLACKETAVIHFFASAVAVIACRFNFGTTINRSARPENIHFVASRETGASIAKIIFTAAIFIATTILLFTWFQICCEPSLILPPAPVAKDMRNHFGILQNCSSAAGQAARFLDWRRSEFSQS